MRTVTLNAVSQLDQVELEIALERRPSSSRDARVLVFAVDGIGGLIYFFGLS
jgi:hypothetical protein